MTNSYSPNDVCDKILYSQEEIAQRCLEIGTRISEEHKGGEVTLIAILNGSFMFMADLVKNISVDCRIDFMQVSTYGASSESSGKFVVKKGLSLDIEGKDVIIVEDIVDTGFTMVNLLDYLNQYKPKSIKLCTLIDKPHRRTKVVNADYIGFTMKDNEFIVGYGLDYAQRYRNLPYIGVLKEQIYS